jgi:hypothetical protein
MEREIVRKTYAATEESEVCVEENPSPREDLVSSWVDEEEKVSYVEALWLW